VVRTTTWHFSCFFPLGFRSHRQDVVVKREPLIFMLKKLFGIIFLLVTVIRVAKFPETMQKSPYVGELKDYYWGGNIVGVLITAVLAWLCLRPARD
jgi:hypothetical protein